MKKLLLSILVLLNIFIIHAQQGQWTWMNGSNIANGVGVYGTQGVFAPANTPPGLYEACEWKDLNGNFWLFGGTGDHSDLWQFNPTTNQWAWMNGPGGLLGQAGVYGTQYVASPLNIPGARGWGTATWVDAAGDLWLFGGSGYDINDNNGALNDLWKYHIATNEWTWMAGPNVANDPGTYGTIMIAAPGNNPPSRWETNASWIDNNGNLWLFGGYNGNTFSDLWKYDVSINQWAWMKGPNITNQAAVYGTKGVENPANVPSSRFCYAKWKQSNGDFWFFGGDDGNNAFNDMWRFDPITNNWTWMSGTNLLNDAGTSGTQCVPDSNNVPCARFENRACWTRGCDNFVNMAGTSSTSGSISYNDMWNYNVTTNQWTWMTGSVIGNQAGNYGTITVSSPANMPPSRFGSLGWTDNSGNLWLFGGGVNWPSVSNDMWRFVPDSTCPVISGPGNVTSAFNAVPDSGCVPLTVTFTNTSTNGSTYLWIFGDGNTSTLINPTHTYNTAGTDTVRLIAYNSCNATPDTSFRLITILPGPIASFTADTLTGCDSLTVHFTNNTTNAVSYLWNFGDGNTSTATNPVHTYTTIGTFTVTLIAYGSGVCNDTVTQTINIVSTPVVTSAFISDTISHCDSVTVNFTNNSTNGMTYLWNFGDGNTSNSTSPSHTYTTSGNYTVKLVAYNTGPCGTVADSITHVINIIINHSALAAFNSSDTLSGCDSVAFSFTNNSTNSVSSSWNFGDGNTSTTTSPTHYYSSSGTYTVTLIAIGAGGCSDTVSKNIIVNILHPTVSSAFIADTLHGCSPFTVNFTNNSTNGTSYLWSFGDGGTSTATNPTHIYTDSGTFTVILITNNNSPCGLLTAGDTQVAYIKVDMPMPDTSKFTEQNITGCVPLTVTFTNQSINAQFYYWTFGDGWVDSSKNPVHTYIDTGTFIVTLITTNPSPYCRNAPDTSVFEYIIADSCNIYIPNVFSPNGDGKNEYFYLNAEGYTNYHLVIYNRWGEKLFESTDSKILWNGKINNTGADAPDGTYYYIFTANDPSGKLYKTHGYLTLIR